MTGPTNAETGTLVGQVGDYIRSTHPAAYNSGEWGRILEIVQVSGRACYRVGFYDEMWDDWVIEDPDAGYEFASGLPFDREQT